ncbi:MAG: RNA methyltransferase [Clostridiales bacterium]|nr:RNA methyltransferase [Clostridiales bacterium]
MEKKTIWDLDRPDLESYRSTPKLPIVVILDNIRSLNNIGSIFRTCDAFRVKQICLCGITATPPSTEIHKTALGAEDSVQWRYFRTTLEAIRTLKMQGYTIMVLEQVKGSVDLTRLRIPADSKVALIAGNEVDGVDPEVVNEADICVEIPQEGTKHSLNVSVSTALLLWEVYKQMRAPQE